MKIYISHSSYCSGWNIDNILEGTIFEKSATTNRFPPYPESKTVKMLDWDFKNPNWLKHLTLVKKHSIDTVMTRDVLEKKDITNVKNQVKQLQPYTERIVIPIHYYDNRLKDYELALPSATQKFSPKPLTIPLWKVKNQITHILGGTPEKQLRLMRYLPNIESVDGNLIFWSAIYYGKYWKNESPYWYKPDDHMTNEEIFKLSVANVDKAFTSS